MSSKLDIDLKRIKADLKESGRGGIPFKVHKGNGARVSIRETDKRTNIYINPHKIRTQAQLDSVMQLCVNSLTWGMLK